MTPVIHERDGTAYLTTWTEEGGERTLDGRYGSENYVPDVAALGTFERHLEPGIEYLRIRFFTRVLFAIGTRTVVHGYNKIGEHNQDWRIYLRVSVPGPLRFTRETRFAFGRPETERLTTPCFSALDPLTTTGSSERSRHVRFGRTRFRPNHKSGTLQQPLRRSSRSRDTPRFRSRVSHGVAPVSGSRSYPKLHPDG